MSGRGGTRHGAGRKPGTANAKSVEVAAKALEEGITPIEYMLSTMRDEDADPKERQWAAEKSAPFVHPRPAPSQRTIEIELPELDKVEGIKDAIQKVASEVALGNIAPSEAQSLVSIIEAQRKTIETVDIVERIENLERQQTRYS